MGYTREGTSVSAHGVPTKIAATSTPGTTLHTAQASTTLVDVVTVQICNTDTVTRRVTLEWGGTTAPDHTLIFDIPPKATVLVISDHILRNSLVLKAFCDVANVCTAAVFTNVEA